ncbi:hypothetical protein FCM35_KLT17774 [Carex littledalei]|uniref:Uncharacterized protein n=1 Tax=Carex littledalei TaxID=544730 RepID=A0A833R9A8_9POAL|nr:hypothetical protein FCM35_KLT17774 [Carex littledalei]
MSPSTDWGPIVVAVILFILLSPGLLFQLPAHHRVIEFGNMGTSGISVDYSYCESITPGAPLASESNSFILPPVGCLITFNAYNVHTL